MIRKRIELAEHSPLTMQETMEILRVKTRKTVYKLIDEGHLERVDMPIDRVFITWESVIKCISRIKQRRKKR